jgi:hypothetical protein
VGRFAEVLYPRGLAFGPNGNLYVSSLGSRAVFELDSNGEVVHTFGGFGEPHGLAFGPNGDLFVADATAKQIVELSPDGTRVRIVVGTDLTYPIELKFSDGDGACGPLPIEIDIKPGSFPNSVSAVSHGVIPVAVLSTETFDAAMLDPETVRFGATGFEAAPVHGASGDVDGDSDADLVLHFATEGTDIVCGTTEAALTGRTWQGTAVRGEDAIKTVGCR